MASASAKSKRNNNNTNNNTNNNNNNNSNLRDNLLEVLSRNTDNYKDLPEWWNRFSLKLINLIVLLKQKKLKYTICGSGAVALLAYFFKPELLEKLKEPNDGDIYIIDNYKRDDNFKSKSFFNFDTYIILEHQMHENSKSATFIDPNPKPDCFESIDLTMSTMQSYVKLAKNINVFVPKKLLSLYTGNTFDIANRTEKNAPKISVLSNLMDVKGIDQIGVKTHKINNNNRRRNFKQTQTTKKRNIFKSPKGAAAPSPPNSPKTPQPPKFPVF